MYACSFVFVSSFPGTEEGPFSFIHSFIHLISIYSLIHATYFLSVSKVPKIVLDTGTTTLNQVDKHFSLCGAYIPLVGLLWSTQGPQKCLI